MSHVFDLKFAQSLKAKLLRVEIKVEILGLAVDKLNKGEAAGIDSLQSEHLTYAHLFFLLF